MTEGEHGRAATYIVSALFNGLGAGGDLLTGLKGFGGVLHSLEQGGESAPALRSLQRQSSLPRYEDLYPAELQEQVFLLGKPNPNGHAPVFHATPVSSAPPRAPVSSRHSARTVPGSRCFPCLTPDRGRHQACAPSWQSTCRCTTSPRITVGHATGVCVVNGRHYVELSGSTFQVHYSTQLRGWQIIDPQNPFAFFGNQPIRLDQQGQWQLVERQRLALAAASGDFELRPPAG